MTGAGPFASASLVCLAFPYTTVVASGHGPLSGPVGTFLWAVTLTSIVSCLGNLLPTQASAWDKNFPSDGSRLDQIIRHGLPDQVPALCAVG